MLQFKVTYIVGLNCNVYIILDTRVPINDSNVSDILGISCVIINDLKQRRQKDYDFSWDRVLQVSYLKT